MEQAPRDERGGSPVARGSRRGSALNSLTLRQRSKPASKRSVRVGAGREHGGEGPGGGYIPPKGFFVVATVDEALSRASGPGGPG